MWQTGRSTHGIGLCPVFFQHLKDGFPFLWFHLHQTALEVQLYLLAFHHLHTNSTSHTVHNIQCTTPTHQHATPRQSTCHTQTINMPHPDNQHACHTQTINMPHPDNQHATPRQSTCHTQTINMPHPDNQHATPRQSTCHTQTINMHATPRQSTCHTQTINMPHPDNPHVTPRQSTCMPHPDNQHATPRPSTCHTQTIKLWVPLAAVLHISSLQRLHLVLCCN